MRARLPVVFAATFAAIFATIFAVGAPGYSLSVASLAWAAPTVVEGDVAPVVAVVIAGSSDAGATSRLTGSLRRSLRSLHAIVAITEVASMNARDVATVGREPSVARASAWIDLGTTGRAVVYVTGGDNVFVRELDIGRSLDSVALDLLDVVVTDSIATLLSGGKLGLTREAFSRAFEKRLAPAIGATPPMLAPASGTGVAPSAVAGAAKREEPGAAERARGPSARATTSSDRSPVPTPRRRPFELDAAIGYEISRLAPSRIVHGPGLRLTVGRASLRLELGARARFLGDGVANGVTVDFRSAGVLLSVGYAFRITPRWALVPSVGAGADVTRVHTTSSRAEVVSAGTFFAADPIVRPMVTAEGQLGRVIAKLSLGLDLDVAGSRYVVSATPRPLSVLEPSRLRPLFALAIGLAL